MTSFREMVESAIRDRTESLHNIGRTLFENPELNYEERIAHDLITGILEQEGFRVERHYILETAFRAEFGNGQPVVTIMCEYDALPNIGHACGHNLIAECSVAAGIAVKEVLKQDVTLTGKVLVMGTPAEEAGFGKIQMLKAGAFKDADVAMMLHPAPASIHTFPSSAHGKIHVKYRGKEAHSGAAPWEGINALDAAVGAYVNVSMLRQQMKPSWKVTGVIKDVDARANVTPSVYKMEFVIRAPKAKELLLLNEKVEACINSAAAATGCEVEITIKESFVDDVITNIAMANVYKKYAEMYGMRFPDLSKYPLLGASTDAGSVSYVVPLIHPTFRLDTRAVNHTPEFTKVAGSPDSLDRTLTAAKALALTALEVIRDPELLKSIKEEFEATRISQQ
ncbi:unnamed protein product [Ixodes persulcatus]